MGAVAVSGGALARIDWASAIRRGAGDRAVGASLESLSALFAEDFNTGLAALRRAGAAEPLNPLHDLRVALFHARFGDFATAAEALQRLRDYQLSTPVIDYLRALLALRGGRADQARAIAATLENAFPDFAPAKFLRAEAQLISSGRGTNLDRYLRGLPVDARWQAGWADLLIKVVLFYPADGPAVAVRFSKNAGQDNVLRLALDKANGWVAASPEELSDQLAQEPAGSRGEALLLECLVDALRRAASNPAALRQATMKTLLTIRAAHADRAALVQVFHAFQTYHAAEAAADGRYEEALRFTERSIADIPYELAYYQNRAALFTLMREPTAYHEAWETLNTHQYRLLLLGVTEPVLDQTIKLHRVFAQQALGGVDRLAGGVLQLVVNGDDDPWLRVDSEAIAADPDLLRQWYHHKRAELVLRHLKLRTDGRHALLDPVDRDAALVRAAALDAFATSLPVLVEEEGEALATMLGPRWASAANGVQSRYVIEQASPNEATDGTKSEEPLGDEAVDDLGEEHVTTLADLRMVISSWLPQYDHLWIAEELLAWVPQQLSFAPLATLLRMTREQGRQQVQSVSYLVSRVRGEADWAELSGLREEHLAAAMDMAMANLLRNMADAAYSGFPGSRKDSAAHAMEYIRRARALRPAEALVEYTAARLLTAGEYFDEASKAVEKLRRLAGAEEDWLLEEAARLGEILAEHRKKGEAGEKFDPQASGGLGVQGDARRVSELLAELDDAPGSWRLYAALIKELVLADRIDEAIEWADRCVSRCLGRSEQIGARGLAIETRALKTMAAENPRAAKLFVAGAFDPVRRTLESIVGQDGVEDFALLYLLGCCQLETGLPDSASTSFRRALEQCDQAIYRPVLRRLTEDIDQPYLVAARRLIEGMLQKGEHDDGIAQAFRVLAQLKRPEAWLVDLARLFCSIAAARAKAETLRSALPAYAFAVEWRPRLDQALTAGDDIDRAIAIADLAQELDPNVAARAKQVADRARMLRRQLAAAAALAQAGQALSDRQFDKALALIDALDPAVSAQPRLRRLRVLALLGLHHFDEADAEIARFDETNSADIRDFLTNYPTFALRQRIALAQKRLREGKAQDTIDLLRNMTAPGEKEEGELAYCLAFAATLGAYERRKGGDAKGARDGFQRALTLLDPHVRKPGVAAHLTELYDRLETEADQYVR